MSVLVIAEIGGNHDGSPDRAYMLIEAAAAAGADAVKFQLFNPDTLYPGKRTEGSIPARWLRPLSSFCESQGVVFGCSVFDVETLEQYLEIDPAWVKIASPEATNRVLLQAAANSGVPLLVSTGAMDEEMVDDTMDVLSGSEVTLLHCVSAYPADPLEMNLAAIGAMRDRYDVPVGLSDHTTNFFEVPMLAVAAGAAVIEKHLTLNKQSPGADHSFALDQFEFATMVAGIRVAESVLGDGVKVVQPSEDPTDRRPQ